MILAGIILAAGASTRMGKPKALLELHGETFLDRLVRLFAPHCHPVIVVLGHEPERIRTGRRGPDPCVFVENPCYADGQLSSLQCGLRSVPAEADGFLFTLVDRPAIRESTVGALAAAAQSLSPPWIILPRREGRRGHPAGCSRDLLPEFLALPRDSQARDVIERHREHTCYVEVADPGILTNVDDPEAYRALVEAMG